MPSHPAQKTVEGLVTTFDHRDKTVFDIIQDASDTGTKRLVVEIERKPPVRAETPARSHQFRAMDGFVSYLNNNGDTDTLVLCDPISGCFAAVLYEHMEDGFEQLTFTPQPHPAFVEWQNMLDKAIDFPTLAAFIHRQRRTVQDGDRLARQLRQIKASTKVELFNGVGKDAVNGITYTAKIQGKENGVDAELPEVLVVTVPMYMDSVVPTVLEIDLTLEAKDEGKKIVAVLSAPTLKTEMFKALQVYAEACKDFQFGFGTPQHTPWQYLPSASF